MGAPPFKVKALYEYLSDHEDDLKFPAGQIINVVEREGEDWYVGEYVDGAGSKQQGLFPTNFVERFEPEVPSRPIRSPPSNQPTVLPTVNVGTPDSPTLKSKEQPPHNGSADAPNGHESQARAPPSPSERPQEISTAANFTTVEATVASRPAPPPVAPKSSAFKDRIAAFNRVEQSPIQPFQPGRQSQPGGFIKKPFVAPPPSSSSYVPIAPKNTTIHLPYVRDEDPEIRERLEQDRAAAQAVGLMNDDKKVDDPENQEISKPMSLKERLALLQEQQRLQVERSVEAVQRKEKHAVSKNASVPLTDTHSDLADASSHAGRQAEHEVEDSDNDGQDEYEGTTASLAAPRQQLREQPKIPAVPTYELVSGGEEADQSAIEGSEDDAVTIGPVGQDYSDQELPSSDMHEVSDKDEGDEDLDEEEERKQRLRERMARLAGPQGGAALAFNPFGPPPTKTRSVRDKYQDNNASNLSTETRDRVSIMPMPGMQAGILDKRQNEDYPTGHVQSSSFAVGTKEFNTGDGVSQGENDTVSKHGKSEGPTEKHESMSSRRQNDADVDLSPHEAGERIHTSTKRPIEELSNRPPVPVPTEADPRSPGPGSESDDEMSMHAIRSSTEDSVPVTSSPVGSSRLRADDELGLPSNRTSRPPQISSPMLSVDVSDVRSAVPEKKVNRAPPPVPGYSSVMSRPPPPPPPLSVAADRAEHLSNLKDDEKSVIHGKDGESDYEGDYDTDIASGEPHKDALKSHLRDDEGRGDSLDGGEKTTVSASRPVPPIPVHGVHTTRTSNEHQRPPPPIPSTKSNTEIDYDPFRYPESNRTPRAVELGDTTKDSPIIAGDDSSADDVMSREASFSVKPIGRAPPPPPAISVPVQTDANSTKETHLQDDSQITELPSRQNAGIQKSGAAIRRSIDHPRPSADLDQIAADVELDTNTPWWSTDAPLPPILQARNGSDVLSESEQTIVSKRGGRSTVCKDIYVLYMDYSQSVLTVRYDSRDISDVSFEQRHEPPPPKLRQDQLEVYWQRFGSKIGHATKNLAANKKDSIQGDGSPHALLLELIKAFPDALLPVGIRAYGALVYANLANASTMQFDEIRAGDVIALRNAKFEGHHGTIKQKYKHDYGTNHVAVVEEWDGTKRTVRAWEQGREKKGGVRSEKFRLGDLRSGEVRIWRVVGRDWVGWESSN